MNCCAALFWKLEERLYPKSPNLREPYFILRLYIYTCLDQDLRDAGMSRVLYLSYTLMPTFSMVQVF
ncbi:hypothetical protein A3841_18365 [Pontibacter flavimaris]|uniref:Uncharacterized protein n=1 Tax=Pontibacter flavimaris TaxID=1797110 RepID=A0A1Q5PDG8_9BACT|nr:hypothetical protein A3841_18365 [Pontibacter flavimaris]